MRLVIALAALWLVVACSAGGSGTATGGPSVPASQPAGEPSPDDARPPQGVLSVLGAEVVGFPGTYCWRGLCADVFDTPPGAELPLVEASAGSLTFTLEDRAPFLSWSVSYRADDDEELTPLAQGGSDYDPDTGSTAPPALDQAEFDTPPAGDWVLIVQIFFEDGDAQYMWHVVVN